MSLALASASTNSTPPRGRSESRTRVGVDVQVVDEITVSLAAFGERYVSRVFNAEEVAHVRRHPSTAASYLAGRFAAREAVIKVLGVDSALAVWRDIDIVAQPTTTPRVVLIDSALELANSLGITEILLSLSHARHVATAVAVADVISTSAGGSP